MSWSFRAASFRAWTFRAQSLAGVAESIVSALGGGGGRKRLVIKRRIPKDVAKVIQRVAKQQVLEAGPPQPDNYLIELIETLKALGLAYEEWYAQALKTAREKIVAAEIRRLIVAQQRREEDEIVMILAMI